jgi:plasmid stabilization system protein ParE
MVKRLIVSRKAYINIDKIVEFNNTRNKSTTYSHKFLKALFKQLNLLKKFPLMGIPTDEENVFLMVWNQYYIYYTLIEDIIEIQAVRHQREDVR